MTVSKLHVSKMCAHRTELNAYRPAGIMLRRARKLLDVPRGRIAARMGISKDLWMQYESGAVRVPNSLMLKIFMFGLDFWCERDV